MARKTTQTRKAVVTALAWAIGFLIFFPILWTILMSFKSEGDAIKAPLDMLAAHFRFQQALGIAHPIQTQMPDIRL